MEIKRLFAFTKRFSKISEELPDVKIHEEIIESANIPEKIKFKCDLCSSSFKKEITLQKHKNTKHDPNYCSPKKKIGEGSFGYAFDVRPGQEAAAESLRLEWREKNMDDYNLNDKCEKDDHENSMIDEKSKESDFLDAEDYF